MTICQMKECFGNQIEKFYYSAYLGFGEVKLVLVARDNILYCPICVQKNTVCSKSGQKWLKIIILLVQSKSLTHSLSRRPKPSLSEIY